MLQSNFEYLQNVRPEQLNNPYIQKRIGQFQRQIDELKRFANCKEGKIHNILMGKIDNYEALLDRLESL